MTSNNKHLPKAIEAMKRVYGDFEKDITALNNYAFPPNPHGHNGRYLWTDAFAVCNFISLYRVTRDSRYLVLAERLVRIVHNVLGSTRDQTRRLPGASEEHPLRGGLRIGKIPASGMDSDGQYYHYLTVWMFALNRLSKVTNKTVYNDLGIELVQAVHPKFLVRSEGRPCPKIVWKMNTDLTDVLVSHEGNMDAAQGYLAYTLLQEANRQDPNILSKEINDLKMIVENHIPRRSRHKDPLDLGMGLWIAHYFADLKDENWAKHLKKSYSDDVDALFCVNYFNKTENPLGGRLPFREFGLALGLACIFPTVETNKEEHDKRKSQIEQIIETWQDLISPSRSSLLGSPDRSFLGLRHSSSKGDKEIIKDIDLVMYASAICPIEFEISGNGQVL